MRFFLFYLCFFTLFFFYTNSSNALSDTLNDKEAMHLKALMQGYLENKKNISANKNQSLTWQGEVDVEITPTHYAITLPHISLISNDTKKGRIEIGTIAINAKPHSNDKMWKMTIALPTPIIHFNAEGSPINTIELGAQRLAGIWHEDLQLFLKLDARYENISLENKQKNYNVSIPSLHVLSAFEKTPNNTWSGPLQVTLDNFTMISGPQKNSSIGKVQLDFDISELNADIYQSFINNKHNKSDKNSVNKLKNPDDKNLTAPQNDHSNHTDEIKSFWSYLAQNLIQGMNARYEVKDVSLSQPGLLGSKDAKLELSQAYASFKAHDFHKNALKLGLSFGYQDLKLPQAMHAASPTKANIDIEFNNVPISQILSLMENSFQGTPKNASMNKMMGMGLALKIPALLAAAQSDATIKNTYLGNKDYSIDINGTAQADLEALNSATVNVVFTVSGMDWLEKTTQESLSSKNSPFAKTISTLVKLKDIAHLAQDENGMDTHAFIFTMDKKGQLLINDQNAMLLLATTQLKKN